MATFSKALEPFASAIVLRGCLRGRTAAACPKLISLRPQALPCGRLVLEHLCVYDILYGLAKKRIEVYCRKSNLEEAASCRLEALGAQYGRGSTYGAESFRNLTKRA